MAELMGDPRDPDAHDDARTAADDLIALALETAPADTSAAVGGDAAAAREAAAHCKKGHAHFKRHEWAEALKAYRAAVKVDPKMSEAWFWISAAECEMNGGEPCEEEYVPLTRCIKLDPNNAMAHLNFGSVLLDVRKDPTKAEESFREAIRLDPALALAHNNLGLLLHIALKKPTEAKESYLEAIRLEPKFARAHGNYSLLLEDQGDLGGD